MAEQKKKAVPLTQQDDLQRDREQWVLPEEEEGRRERVNGDDHLGFSKNIKRYKDCILHCTVHRERERALISHSLKQKQKPKPYDFSISFLSIFIFRGVALMVLGGITCRCALHINLRMISWTFRVVISM